MRCACCGRRRKLMESFENIGAGGDICVDCSDLLYRIKDAAKENDKKEYERNIQAIKSFFNKKKSTDDFKKWFVDDFIKRS